MDEIQNFVELGPVARNRINMQCQYAARYIKESGVRYKGDPQDDYHSVLIAYADIEKFISYVKKERNI